MIRAKFIRGEEIKYISHLDLMKAFERAIRRAEIPIAYSQGFNPHPHMVFGLPLSVGVTSQAEYGDFELSQPMNAGEFMGTLNKELPPWLKIIEAGEKRSGNNIMASIAAACYDILLSSELKTSRAFIEDKITELLMKPEITVKKTSKRGIREVDIRPMIHRVSFKELNGDNCEQRKDGGLCVGGEPPVSDSGLWLKKYIDGLSDPKLLEPSWPVENIFCLSVLLSAGSSQNLKPEIFADAFLELLGQRGGLVKIHRTELFTSLGGNLASPLDNGVIE
ncbi:TIGR03936 family radical SAM-associated protein [Anaerobacterium chartisolvens]|uniref:TIGR03936 family radical SAM-associated protein n=1 Tax=Anaerobacterium chartisolvens TaxID=1297424 RepID=UPI001FA821C3|nr:TIGR03936 family radical SAM-associated protein [Anaerobacterium chartisolvens]